MECRAIVGRGGPLGASRHLVVGIDNTQGSKAALEWVVKHLYRPGDFVHLLNVVSEPDTLHFHPGLYTPPDDAEERAEFCEAEAFVRAAFAPTLRLAQIPSDVHIIVAPDDPDSIAAVLLAKAQELQQLEAAAAVAGDAPAPAGAAGSGAAAGAGPGGVIVVVASHGRPRLEELWTGSVCATLLRKARVPLIVHRSPAGRA